MTAGSDRRAYTRHPALIRALFYFDGRICKGTIVDYSESGLFVSTDTGVAEGDTLLLRFRRPGDRAVVQVQGMVARVVQDTGAPHQHGFGAQLFELLSTVQIQEGPADAFGGSIPVGSSLRADGPDDEPGGPAFRARDSRHVTHMEGTYRPLAGAGVPRRGRVLNVSRRGVFFETEEVFQPGARLILEMHGLDVDGDDVPLEMIAEVAWQGSRFHEDRRATGIGCRLLAPRQVGGWTRWECMQRDLIVVGNPLFARTEDDDSIDG
jgi:hypothetical protein